MVLRIEDTDRERSTPENVGQIIDALQWLELDWDGEPVSQYDRRERHALAVEQLLESGRAYKDPSSGDEVREWKAANGNRGYRGEPRDEPGAATRLRVPDDGSTVVHDLLRGDVSFPNDSQDDFVIARGDGTPLYNLAVAVDDAEMGITDVIRGDDHLSNTPKQAMVLEALGHEPPRYVHLPLLHGPDGKKLSKRHGAASVQELRDAGYLPEAVRNYLALLGWGTDDDTTIMSTEELVSRFDVARIGRASAIFDEQKLRWLNGRFMRELDPGEYAEMVADHLERSGVEPPSDREHFAEACRVAQDKAQTLDDVWPLIRFVFSEPVDDEKARQKFLGPEGIETLKAVHAALESVPEWSAETLEEALSEVVERLEMKPGAVYQPIRVAITGSTISPGIFDSLALLGRDETLNRLLRVISG
ncbi:MAG: nondiscriminating glutamyl-tRNA synthetase [Solirubrobacterales bacterium]|jgi:glutamyl-tRNA synthetase|nr:nondiscriminating glutamyl-tRNA synthetase [Solirubrobacterales bacterium]